MDIDHKRLVEIISKFNGIKAAIIGDIALDHYKIGIVERLNPERRSAPLLKVTKNDYRLGCAANVAENISSLNAKTLLYGIIGPDQNGEEIKSLCERKHIRFFPLIGNSTIVKLRLIAENPEDYLARADDGEKDIHPISDLMSENIINDLKIQLPNVILLSDYNKGMFSKDLAQKIIVWANQNDIITIVDPKPINAHRFNNATLFCPNIHEAKEITKMYKENKNEVAKKLKEITNSKFVVITCGEDGMISYDGEFHEMPTHAKIVADPCGAGDTVAALLSLSLSSKADIIDACNISNFAAGIVVERMGTSSVKKEELIDRILAS